MKSYQINFNAFEREPEDLLKNQVINITHLPQVAAMGQSHFKIYKEDNNGVTVTKMEKLNENNRIVEIANMLEGNNASESAYLHAKQLLN